MLSRIRAPLGVMRSEINLSPVKQKLEIVDEIREGQIHSAFIAKDDKLPKIKYSLLY